jgi:hypothetical protein
MDIELHRLRQHLSALKLALNNPREGHLHQLLAYLDTDINNAITCWAELRNTMLTATAAQSTDTFTQCHRNGL